MTTPSVTIRCARTGVEAKTTVNADGSLALPRGWKRLCGQVFSPEGKEQGFALRAVSLPVQSVTLNLDEPDWSVAACTEAWKAFRGALKTSFQQATQVCNYAMTHIAMGDAEPLIRTERGFKLPSRDVPESLYRDTRLLYPTLDSQSVGSLLQKVRAKYSQVRWDLRVRASTSLPTFRYPVPIPLPSTVCKLALNEQHQPFLTVRVSGQRFLLRLRNGPERARQIQALRRLQAGECEMGEVVLSEQTSGSSHRNGGERRHASGANRQPTRIMARIALWMPRENVERIEGKVLHVRSTETSLFVAAFDTGDPLWQLHESWVPRLVYAHRARLQAFSDDTKFERRRPRRNQANLNDARNRLCEKHHRRINDFLHKASKMLVDLARRNKCERIEYDDSIHAWCPDFPWADLRTKVKQKAAELNIGFVDLGVAEADADDV